MAYDIRVSDDFAKIILSGDVDLQTTADLKTEILKITDVAQLEIEAGSVTYIDSSGVACLIMAYKQLAAAGAKVRLVNPAAALMNVLKILKFDSLFSIEND